MPTDSGLAMEDGSRHRTDGSTRRAISSYLNARGFEPIPLLVEKLTDGTRYIRNDLMMEKGQAKPTDVIASSMFLLLTDTRTFENEAN